jgi:geranylgeranyl diphosphate synthase type I
MSSFEETLSTYRQKIDADIEEFTEKFIAQTVEQFGDYPTEAVKAYVRFLTRGGKRIRGVLTMHSYYMFGGRDETVALHAARAIEMLHAYILAVDDIQDRSETRRGGPTVHIDLKNYHNRHVLKGDAHHFGESIAMNAFLIGVHSALDIITDLQVPSEFKLAAIRNVNKHFIGTAHGQSLDIFNEVTDIVTEKDVNNVLLWKTAFYTFANPMQLGAIIAGADEQMLLSLEEFSMNAGRAFQITDDILGIYGEDEKTGKNSKDDIIEGKRTILTTKALEMANEEDAAFLRKCLDNVDLTDEAFDRCKEIITLSGAKQYAKDEAQKAAEQAKLNLQSSSFKVEDEYKQFLRDLISAIASREA